MLCWICHLHHHGPEFLGLDLELQLLILPADEIECLLRPPELVAPTGDHEGEVVCVAQH